MNGRSTQRLHVLTVHEPVTVCIEPWASEHCLPVNGHFILEAEGPAYPHAHLQILHDPDRLTVYTWDGADYRIVNDQGQVISDWTGNRVPDFYADPRLR